MFSHSLTRPPNQPRRGWLSFVLAVLGIMLSVPAFAQTPPAPPVTTPDQLQKLQAVAKEGNAEAQNSLATFYFIRSLTTEQKDYELAVEWYAKAAAQGHAGAIFNLGICYERGLGVKADLDRALGYYRQAADMGLEKAQLNTALTLRDMRGLTEAAKYFEMAAVQGNVVCQREIGKMYVRGEGLERDAEAGIKFLTRAADNGDLEAMLFLADCYSGAYDSVTPDLTRMIDFLWRAAGKDSPEAMSKIGYCYEVGLGLPKDTGTAVKWYRRATELRYPQAMINLANCYAVGRGVAQDAKQAFELYQRAADLGLPLGDYNLGVCHALGQGTPVDEARALASFERAAKAELPKAQYHLGLIYAEGRGTARDPQLAFYWFRQAAQQNEPRALTALAWCYYRGTGIPVDQTQAKSLFERAAQLQDEEAVKALSTLFPDEKD